MSQTQAGKENFKKQTVGSIMSREFLAVSQASTVDEAILIFRNAKLEKVSKPSYVYVVDSSGRLVGVLQMRNLLSHPPQTLIKDIMNWDVVKAQADVDQEEAVRLFVKHNFMALPVVDRLQKLIGVVTSDEILDVAELEANEDIAKIVGTGADEITTHSVPRIVRLRLPWLAISIISGLICAFILGRFRYEIETAITLALFIPVVLGLSESTGMQSSTIVVRNIALGRTAFKDINWLLRKEILVGIVVGMTCGLIVGAATLFWQGNSNLGTAVALSMSFSITVAAVIGSLLPLLFRLVRIDPALASGPIVLATCDVVTLLIYFRIAGILLAA